MSFKITNKNADLDLEQKSESNKAIKRRRTEKNIEKKSKHKLVEKKCKHDIEFFTKESQKAKNKSYIYKFCQKCISLFIYSEETDIIKTIAILDGKIGQNYFDPYLNFLEAKKNYIKENLSYLNPFLKYRKDMINFVLKLKNKYKASSDSFYLSIRLIDIVCSKIVKFEIDIELISIGCFFLACKIKELF